MLRAQHVIICEYVREGPHGKYDILGVFDRTHAQSLPAQQRQMVFSALLIAETEDDIGKKRFTFRCLDPDKNPIFELRGMIEIRPAAGTWFASARMTVELGGMPLPKAGRYRFLLEVEGKHLADHPFTVVTGLPPGK